MNPAEFEIMNEVESQHWWYQGMAYISRSLLNRWCAPHGKIQILDAGCGTGGAMTNFLCDYGKVTGFDIASQALAYCAERGADRLAQASVSSIPFVDKSFELVTCFDVLSDAGVRNDADALAEFFRVLAPDGRILLRLPAYPWLHGNHDKAVLTFRRYTASQAAQLVSASGFIVDFCSYVNTILFPVIAVKRLAERVLQSKPAKSDLFIKFGPFNPIFKIFLMLEAFWLRWMVLPWGLSIMLVGRKPLQ